MKRLLMISFMENSRLRDILKTIIKRASVGPMWKIHQW